MPPKEASLPFLIGVKNFNSIPFTSLIIETKINGNAINLQKLTIF